MLQAEAPALVLASASAARRALLEGAGVTFATRPASLDEAHIKRVSRAAGANASDAALSLAFAKAAALGDINALVIGADQILVCDGAWFDKPADLAQARAHLLALRGRSHVLHTAIVCTRAGQLAWSHISHPTLTMRHFSDAFLDAYLAAEAGKLLASVGAYRLEGRGINLFQAIEGDQSAILGLPLLPLLGFLRDCGIMAA
jgi:septum formation protein